VVFEGVDPATLEFSMSAPTARAVGGQLAAPPQPGLLHLRVLLDHSCLEAFTAGGEVLTTRVYRGSPPPEQAGDAGLDFVAYGGGATLARLEAHEMGGMWREGARAAAGGGAGGGELPFQRVVQSKL
jgi:beta-fructofuranosidase